MNLQNRLNQIRRTDGFAPTLADLFPNATPESIRQEITELRGDSVMRLSLQNIGDQTAMPAPKAVTTVVAEAA